MNTALVPILFFAACLALPAGAQNSSSRVGGPCEGCELVYQGMPESPEWRTSLAPDGEPGEPIEIEGTVYRPDGRTPAPGIIVYAYHTDARGYYSPSPDQTDGRTRHGHLRGWMRTNDEGAYAFRSIRPAAYPSGRDPAHIHMIIKEPDKNEYYIDDVIFRGDPLVRAHDGGTLAGRGGNGLIELKKDARGVWRGRRDILLGKNVENYP